VLVALGFLSTTTFVPSRPRVQIIAHIAIEIFFPLTDFARFVHMSPPSSLGLNVIFEFSIIQLWVVKMSLISNPPVEEGIMKKTSRFFCWF